MALRRAGRRWHVVLASASVSGLWAAAAAGLGVFARTGLALRQTARSVAGLPALPAARQPARGQGAGAISCASVYSAGCGRMVSARGSAQLAVWK